MTLPVLLTAALAAVTTAGALSAPPERLAGRHTSYLSCGKLYYRTLHMDESRDILYVGAMDRIIKVDMSNVSRTSCERDSLHLEPTNVANCVSKGKTEDYDCRNHVRVIQPIGDGSRLYVCGTNAHNPRDQVVYANLTKLARHEFVPGVGSGVAKCPFDPEDNSTAVWVESGNPGGLPGLYSGTNAEFTKADTVIFRTDLYEPASGRREYSFKRTIKYDSHMLDKPDFVGSYEVGEHVYFFFREVAVEYMNCGKAVYSRVARVCKRDTGGKNILHQNWATYLKARLNCSIPGEFPYYFNEIQDVYKLPDDDTTFHAVFTTSLNGLMGSAVCSFDLADIGSAFEGKFKEQASSTSAWLPVPSSKVPEPRPGSCVPDTRDLPDRVLNFMRGHPLMDETVGTAGGGPPAFYKRDVVFTRLAVERVSAGLYSDKREYTVFYLATSKGAVYKVSQWREGGGLRSQLLDVFQAGLQPEPVRALRLSRRRGALYVATDAGLRQVNVRAMCAARYTSCARCSRDPTCGWDREASVCRPAAAAGTAAAGSLLIHDPAGVKEGLCEAAVYKRKLLVNFGQSVHLSCSVRRSEAAPGPPAVWHHYSKLRGRYTVGYTPEKTVLTNDNGLVVIGVTEPDAGRYDCLHAGQIVSSYHVAVDTDRCLAPTKTEDYQKIYAEWCNLSEKYKLALKTWEKWQGKCNNNNNSGGEDQRPLSNEIYDSSRFY